MVKPGYKQTEVGVIPEDWDCREINSEIKEISMGPFGSDIPVSCFTSEGVPVLSGHSVSKAKLIDTFKNYVSEEKAKSLKKAVAQQGDIIVTHRGTIGQISYIPIGSRYKKYVISQSQFRVRLNGESVNPHFVVSYFLSPKGQSFLLEKKGHTGVPALAQPTTNFRKLCIPLPSLPEQERIVNAFEDIDDFITLLEKQISKKKAIKQGAMQELLTGKKRLAGFTGEITYKPLRTLCTTFADGDWIESKDQSCDGIRLIQTGNVGNGRYIDKQDKQRFISKATFERLHCLEIFEGDVLISRLPEPAGRACILPASNKRRITAVDCTVVRFSSYNPVLFVAYSQTRQYQEKVDMAMAGSTRQRISRKELGEVLVPVFPTIDEQNAVAAIFAHMDGEIVALEQKLEKYRQVKQGMMQQLLTGKIRLM